MSESYTIGGDSLFPLDMHKTAGQTFRVSKPHTLHWIDLNMRIWAYLPEPAVQIFYANASHEPFGDTLSRNRGWLPDISFTPRDWAFFESWGKTLTETYGWFPGPPLKHPEITFANSSITLVNPGYTSSHIDVPIAPGHIPLLGPYDRHLYLHHHSPIATGHPQHHWISYALVTEKNGDIWYLEAVISRGTDWPPYAGLCGLTPLGSSYYEGNGPKITDFTQQWIACRTQHGLNPDPTGWSITAIMLLVEDTFATPGSTLTNNYLGLAHTRYEPAPKDDYNIIRKGFKWPGMTYRVRFPMQTLGLDPANYYAILVRSAPPLPLPPPEWQYDQGDATYPRGIRISRDSDSDPWDKYPNDDHMFVEFGTPPALLPPLTPPVVNIAPIGISWRKTCTGYIITLTTNSPCHLFMEHTTSEPLKHEAERILRGISIQPFIRYCFVNWLENEQEEPGDTLYHTFIKDPWPICETRYFTFRSKVYSEFSPSAYPIWKLHFNIQKPSFIGTASNRTCQANNALWPPCHDAPSAPILDNYDAPWYLQFAGVEHVATFWIYRAFLFFNTTDLDPLTQIAGGYLSIFVYDSLMSSSEAEPHLYITQGVQNDPVIITDYGDQLPITDVGGQIRYDALTPGQYHQIPLNDVGLGFINPSGITKLCLRAELDVEYQYPPLGTNWVKFHSQQKGPAYAPKLTICH